MTIRLEDFCHGPAVIVDDELEKSPMSELCDEIRARSIPLIQYKTIEAATGHANNLTQVNFVILDWDFKPTELAEQGVGLGAVATAERGNLVIDFIKKIQSHSGAPIFIISKEDSGKIEAQLKSAGIEGVFVGAKDILKGTGAVIGAIERWVDENSHVYLFKWWTNEWNAKNVALFWELLKADPQWPNIFFNTFSEDGVEPGAALLQTINQLIFGAVATKGLERDRLAVAKAVKPDALKKLYKSLYYSSTQPTDEAATGDIFKKEGKYYLNVRPDCDCIPRNGVTDPDIYLIEGERKKAKNYQDRWAARRGPAIPRIFEIILFHLAEDEVVVFDKRDMRIGRFSEWKPHRISRVSPEYVNSIRHSFSTFIGRVGGPAYPNPLLEEIFKVPESSKAPAGEPPPPTGEPKAPDAPPA